jgi:beta-xylosidase
MTIKSPHLRTLFANTSPQGNALWTADLGNGRYRNPILYADYSDPDVVRHGDHYYMTASSFQCTPGLPILHSKDLVNWRLVNHGIKNLPHPRYAEVQAGCGVWAPSFRYHDGRFWIVFAMPDEGIYVTTATDPAGEWSTPHLMHASIGLIDPCPLWDDDGNAYLVHAYAYSRCGIKHCLRVRPMAHDGSRLLGEGREIFRDEAKHPIIEGPKFLKRDGYYYILAPAGGVATGWQTVLRSRNITGPYEDRIVLEQGSSDVNGPHQGALVDTPDGEWWFLHFQDAGVYGRITHLQPVEWRNHWPEIGVDQDGNGVGEPVAEHAKPFHSHDWRPVTLHQEEFDGPELDPRWQWNANHRDQWLSLTDRPGWARMFAQPAAAGNLERAPNLLLQKFAAPEFSVATKIEFPAAGEGPTSADGADGIEAGVVVMGREHAAIAATYADGICRIVFRRDGEEQRLDSARGAVVRFRVTVSEGGMCAFSYSLDDGNFVSAPAEFQAVAGVWIGARIGLYAVGPAREENFADFDYFHLGAGRADSNGEARSTAVDGVAARRNSIAT